ncbi:MAG: TRAP transporter substrate-binding protein DctP, partial [Burkholderiales bacterium]
MRMTVSDVSKKRVAARGAIATALWISAGLLASTAAVAQEVQLKFAAWGPPQAPMNKATAEWAEMVNKEGAGIIKVTVFWNTLGNAQTVYDNIKNGVADAGWVLQPLVPGKFPKTSVVELPGLFKSSEEASLALWRLYESGFLKDEYDEVKPLAIVPMTGNRIHTRTPIGDVSALSGKKYRVAGKTLGDVVAAFGGTGIQMAWTDIHQSLEKGVIQGTLSPWNDFVPAKFPEVTKFHLDHDFGMIAGLVAMNKKSYDALPANAKAIVDKTSGVALTTWLSREADRNMAQ